MIKAEDLKRHPEDNRVVVIDNMEEFNLWERRKELGFKGIILHDAFPKEELDFIAKDISDVFDKSPACQAIQNKTHYYPGTKLKYQLSDAGYSHLSISRITQCSELIRNINGGVSNTALIRKNNQHPTTPHKHNTTLCITFSGTGTTIVKEDFEVVPDGILGNTSSSKPPPDDTYSIPTGAIVVFDEDIWHMAPSLKQNKDELPRTILAI